MTAVGLLTAALLSVPAAPAGCTGVTVVVEPAREEPQVACVPARAGRSAAEVFEAAGHELTRVQRFPGAVCRVDGVPRAAACVAMPPADAYWGFFHAAADDWVYAALGVDAVEPAAGEAVAMAWQDSVAPVPPGPAPTAATPEGAEPSGNRGTGDRGAGERADGALSPSWSAAVVLAAAAALGLVAWRRRR